MCIAGIDQSFVDLVGDGDGVVFDAQGCDLVELGVGEDDAGGVVWCVDEDGFCFVGEGVCEFFGAVGEAVFCWVKGDEDGFGVGHGEAGAVGVVVGFEDDDLVGGVDEPEDGRRDCLGASCGDGDLGVRVGVDACDSRCPRGDCFTQGLGAGHGCVLVVPLVDCLDGLFFADGWAIEVGEPLGEVDSLVGIGQSGHFGEDGGAEGGETVGGAHEERIVRFGWLGAPSWGVKRVGRRILHKIIPGARDSRSTFRTPDGVRMLIVCSLRVAEPIDSDVQVDEIHPEHVSSAGAASGGAGDWDVFALEHSARLDDAGGEWCSVAGRCGQEAGARDLVADGSGNDL